MKESAQTTKQNSLSLLGEGWVRAAGSANQTQKIIVFECRSTDDPHPWPLSQKGEGKFSMLTKVILSGTFHSRGE